ncbi:helix-turn-helix domain-containing protein [Streptomyces sp. PCS3-D2]|uniref:hypothetical protein n=1 Tax=Streptomyces sp. PCS3-D2 TaxID=1460244 RepID=UPI00044651D4|nr:hypothetical protein [Streptomyces sp. PCS3-D2]WKV74132.1 helix-turn-helix domain-containing protein [Streptomyces sp. PCS3-D2]
MTILRRHLSSGYTVLPTATLEDARLSFRARGILAYLLAKPDTWKVAADRIAKAGKEGVEAVRTALRELKDAGYYRVVTERMTDGTLRRITEVYDQAQDWAAEEFRKLEAKRLERRRKREQTAAAPDASEGGSPDATETGFSGVGSPVSGSPSHGSPGVIGSNQSQYSEKNPLTPAAGAAGGPAAAVREDGPARPAAGGGCRVHPDGAGRGCRGCGTSPRQLREAEESSARKAAQARQRARDAQVISEGAKPFSTLSDVARQAISEIRAKRGETAIKTQQEK